MSKKNKVQKQVVTQKENVKKEQDVKVVENVKKVEVVKVEEKPKQQEKPKSFIESYTSSTNTCAKLIAKSLQQGADLNTLVEKAKTFNQAAGKGAKCLETPASLKAHFRWLICKGLQIEEENGVYKLKSA